MERINSRNATSTGSGSGNVAFAFYNANTYTPTSSSYISITNSQCAQNLIVTCDTLSSISSWTVRVYDGSTRSGSYHQLAGSGAGCYRISYNATCCIRLHV